MGTPAPDALLRLVDRFDLGRKVFISGDCREEQLRMARTQHEPESIQRQIDAPVHELHGLTREETGITVEGDS